MVVLGTVVDVQCVAQNVLLAQCAMKHMAPAWHNGTMCTRAYGPSTMHNAVPGSATTTMALQTTPKVVAHAHA